VVAVVLAAAFGVAKSEEFAPELHDNDAVAALVATNGATPGESAPSAPQGHRPDAPHACHCFHVHVLWADPAPILTAVALDRAGRVQEAVETPQALALSPHLRPPIT
jgi:hypothetical protein